MSLPVLHYAPVQLVPQQVVQIPITEGIFTQMPQQVVHVPQIEQNVSLPVSPHAVTQHTPEHVVQ